MLDKLAVPENVQLVSRALIWICSLILELAILPKSLNCFCYVLLLGSAL